ncbi:MAG: CobW family GTP-binding protein [Pseudomonadota bacterium]
MTVIGGYLGAGKTTLVNRLLRDADGLRLAVLVNEFGALPIDEDLIVQKGDSVIAIAGGCICCAFGDNLIGALNDLATLDPAPEHILIEASGVAIPSSLAANISLLSGFRLSGIVVLADAETVRGMAQDPYLGDTILRQLRDADLVLLTKSDLVDAVQVHDLTTWMQDMCGHARIAPAQNGQFPKALLFDAPPRGTDPQPQPHGDPNFESLVLQPTRPVDAAALAQSLAQPDNGVVRAKGFVTDLSGQTYAVQIVGTRWDATPAGADANGIVCIGLAGMLQHHRLAQLIREPA